MKQVRNLDRSARNGRPLMAGWLGAGFLAIVALLVSGCSPLTRLLVEQERSIQATPPEMVPYLRMSKDVGETHARLKELGFTERDITYLPPGWLERGFPNLTPEQKAGIKLELWTKDSWHRAALSLLILGDEVLFVTWRLQPFTP